MTATETPLPELAPPADPPARRPPPAILRFRVLLGVALPVAALSLLLGDAPTYDVWAWLVWGREIAHLDLSTRTGPSWKPLPIAFAALFSPAAHWTPDLWLVAARAGGLLALGGAARLAWRVAGGWAALVAAGCLVTVHLWLGYLMPYGMSEPLLAALLLWAVDRHADDRPAHTWWLLVAASLLRPEVWPFLLLYGVWVGRRRSVGRVALTVGLLLIPLLWFVPQGFGSGHPFRIGSGQAAPGGPSTQAHPGVAAVQQVGTDLLFWVELGALAGLAYAVLLRDRLLLGLAAFGAAWTLLVAVMAEVGLSSGVSRYLIATEAVASVLAGVGWVGLVRWVADRLRGRGLPLVFAVGLPALAVALAALPSADSFGRDAVQDARDVRYQQGVHDALPAAVRAAGGRAVVAGCGGRPWVGPLQETAVAWELRTHIWQGRIYGLPGPPPDTFRGIMLQTRDRLGDPLLPRPFPFLRWEQVGAAGSRGAGWVILSSCRTAPVG